MALMQVTALITDAASVSDKLQLRLLRYGPSLFSEGPLMQISLHSYSRDGADCLRPAHLIASRRVCGRCVGPT